MNLMRIAGSSFAMALLVSGQTAFPDTLDAVSKIVDTVSSAVTKATSKDSSSDSSKKTDAKDSSDKTASSTTQQTSASSAAATTTTANAAQPAAAQQPAATTAQQSDASFVSDMGFSVTFPSGWAKSRPDANTVSIVDAESNVEFNIQNVPTTANGGKFASASELATELKTQLSQSCQGFKLIGERDCLYSGVQGREFLAEYSINGTGFRQWFSIIPRPDGKTLHQFYFFVPTTSYDKYFPQVQKFLGSWKLTGVEAPGQLRVQPPSLKARAQAASPQAGATPQTATAAVQQAPALKTPDASSVDVKIIKTQTDSAIQAEKGKYTAKVYALQSAILKEEGPQYLAMACPKCGAKEGFALVNWQWQCMKCNYVAASALDTLAPSCKTYREENANAAAEAKKAIAAAKDAGNKSLAAKGYGPLWDLSSDDLALDSNAQQPLQKAKAAAGAAAGSAKSLTDDFFSSPASGTSN